MVVYQLWKTLQCELALQIQETACGCHRGHLCLWVTKILWGLLIVTDRVVGRRWCLVIRSFRTVGDLSEETSVFSSWRWAYDQMRVRFRSPG